MIAADQDSRRVRQWRREARPEQLPRDDPPRITYYRGGRGSGKTWSASHAYAEWLIDSPGGEWGVVSPTFSDARSLAIEGPDSGLLAALGTSKAEVDAGKSPLVASWNRSLGELTLRSGSRIYATGADNGAIRLQGKNLRGVWADEIGLWEDWSTAWDESIRMATRLAGSKIIATGTPKSARKSAKLIRRLIDDPKVDNRLLRTLDNAANLSDEFLEDVTGGLTGRLSRQELEGELIDAEGALWSYEMIDASRVACRCGHLPGKHPDETAGQCIDHDCPCTAYRPVHPELVYIVVAVDPAVTNDDGSDETGIVIAGKGADGHGYVLLDASFKGHPADVARKVTGLYETYRANWIVAEVNNGGDYIGALIKGVNPNVGYKKVRATHGKYLRAEPIAALYEQGRVHHLQRFERMEEQMCTFEPGSKESPDRLDALVYALTECKIEGLGLGWMDVYAPGSATTAADAEVEAQRQKQLEDDNPWLDAYRRR
jgi:phage terminase large subunit-like protein